MNAWSRCPACIPNTVPARLWRRSEPSGGTRRLNLRRNAGRFGLAAWLVLQGGLGCLGQSATNYHAHADLALQSFLLKFWTASGQYLGNAYPSNGTLTSYWTFAHGWDALMDGVERTGGQQYAGLIESFYEGQSASGWTDGYYDDECWMTISLTRAYDLTGTAKYLNQAAALYADIMTGWDTTCCGSSPGGLWWDKAHTQKNNAANAGAALAGARLYQRTGNAAYLSFAQQVYSYWYANMVNPTTFQVCDHLNPDGSKTWWRFTYNEGLMIGASVELNQATGSPSYLANANNIAGYMINNEVTPTAYGLVLYDGTDTGCTGDCHEFKGPAYRYLMRLYAADTSKTQYYAVLKASADALWNLALNPTSTVFSVNWAGPSQSSVAQSQDNAACIALSRFAQQYGPYPGSGTPANQYEAENATLHNVSLEALYGAFTGWGYIAGWNANGQSVDFNINCTTAGLHTLAFRYAAGTGNASRLIAINGVNTFRNQTFPSTGAWESYGTNTVSCTLPAGPNTISVIYKSSFGSANYLNLDNLVVGGDAPETIRITGLSLPSPGSIHLTWTAINGRSYQVQFRDAAGSGTWTNLGAPIIAAGPTASTNDTLSATSGRFYRIVQP
jgi:predicted alpha-1,6-mannanase (GH76 family)